MAALGLKPKEFFKIDIGEVVLDAWMIKPIHFDPLKKYPLFFMYMENLLVPLYKTTGVLEIIYGTSI
jgi:hypothetical protein